MILRMVNKYGMTGTIVGTIRLDNALQVKTASWSQIGREVDLYNSLVGRHSVYSYDECCSIDE